MIVLTKECHLCKQALRVELDPVTGRQVAFDLSTEDEHKCWELPDDVKVLVLDE